MNCRAGVKMATEHALQGCTFPPKHASFCPQTQESAVSLQHLLKQRGLALCRQEKDLRGTSSAQSYLEDLKRKGALPFTDEVKIKFHPDESQLSRDFLRAHHGSSRSKHSWATVPRELGTGTLPLALLRDPELHGSLPHMLLDLI